jgi:cobalamin biosynthesis protein CobT
VTNRALKNIAEIAEVVARVTRILSGRNIQVIQEGLKLGVEYDSQGAPVRVYLPSLVDNPSDELLVAVHGFLDREVSTLLYTDHAETHRRRMSPQYGKKGMHRAMQSVVEEVRTERNMRQDFVGSAHNFNKNHEFAIDEILEPEYKKLRGTDRMALLAMPAIRAAAGDPRYQKFMDGKWESLGKLGGSILHYADDIAESKTTKDTYELTEKIMRRWEEEEKKNGDDEGDGDGDGKGKSKGEAGADDADGGMGAGGGEDDDSEAGENGEGSPYENLDKKNEHLDKRHEQDDARDPNSGSSGQQQGLTEFKKDLEDSFAASDWNSKYEEKIKKLAKDEQSTAPYVPYSRQYDYVGPFPNADKQIARFSTTQTALKVYEQAVTNSHVIQNQIQKLFMAKALVRWEPGLRRGKINATSLHKLRTGDPRVFRRKIESDDRNIAVSLLLDISGSMSGSKVQYAAIAALMFSQVLSKLNISHEISCFSTYYGSYMGSALPDADAINKMLSGIGASRGWGVGAVSGITYGRYAPITNYIAKSYDGRLDESTKRLICMIPDGFSNLRANNVDGESVATAGQRLLARQEKRKVMIVMSDGSPAADGDGRALAKHLKDVVKSLSQQGVEMLGLGMLDRSVTHYYPKSVVVNEVEDIPTKILELTKQLVVGA